MAKLNPTEVQKFLRGISYPATKEALISQARENGAGKEMISAFEEMPGDTFESPVQVNKTLREYERSVTSSRSQ